MLDMAWGSPNFLTPYWNKINLKSYSDKNFGFLHYQIGSSEIIKSAIKSLHIEQDNAYVIDKHVVIGNGATQLISGLLHIFNHPVYAEAPHFSRFPEIADMYGLKWLDKPTSYSTQIITVPNNPDSNEVYEIKTPNVIFDLSYNWKQYTIPQKVNADISIFTLSKATGHASTRFGWALLSDSRLAEQLEHFVEINSAGVSVESQKQFLSIINHQMSTKNTVFNYGERVLFERWKQIKELENKFEFKVLNSNGMFLWALGSIPDGIKALTGNNFGVSNDYFRLNIGCSEEIFNEFIRRYRSS